MLEQKRSDLEVTVHAGPGERHVEYLLHPGSTPVKIGTPLRTVRRVVPIEVAQHRLSGGVEPATDASEVAHASGMRQVVRQWPDAREQRNEMGVSVLEREADGRRLRRRATVPYRGIEIEELGDEPSAIVVRGNFDQPHLKAHGGFAEQVRLPLHPANKRRQIVFVKGTQDLVHDKRLPRASKHLWMLDQVLDEGGAALPAVDSPAEIAIEREGMLQLLLNKGVLPRTLMTLVALGDLDGVRACFDESGALRAGPGNADGLATVNEAFMCACRRQHKAVSSFLLERLVRGQ